MDKSKLEALIIFDKGWWTGKLMAILKLFIKHYTNSMLIQVFRIFYSEGLPFSIRLVKGAYWDYETVTDKQNEFSEYIKNLSRKYIH